MPFVQSRVVLFLGLGTSQEGTEGRDSRWQLTPATTKRGPLLPRSGSFRESGIRRRWGTGASRHPTYTRTRFRIPPPLPPDPSIFRSSGSKLKSALAT